MICVLIQEPGELLKRSIANFEGWLQVTLNRNDHNMDTLALIISVILINMTVWFSPFNKGGHQVHYDV